MQDFTRHYNPTFLAFKEQADRAIAANPSILRLDCLNPVKAVAHSCDISPAGIDVDRAWERYLGRPIRHRFHSLGVRDSLRVLLGWLAGQGRSIAMPGDVYPVYRQIADAVGVTCSSYPTLPAFDLAAALAGADDALLVTAPLSPLGRDLTDAEVVALAAWLQVSPERILILDRVYDYGGGVDIAPLLATGQVAVCWSLSKAFLSPLVMGFCIVPAYLAHLCGQLPDAERAAAILTRHRDFPAEQASIFRYRWRKLATLLSSLDPDWQPPATGYLSVLRVPHAELLARGILAVPGAVYEAGDRLCVISCLHESVAGEDTKIVSRYHATVLSNFARCYDKYSRTYNKIHIPESHFPDRFYLLKEADLSIGIAKASQLGDRLGNDRAIVLRTSVPNHTLQPNERTGIGEYISGGKIEVDGVFDTDLRPLLVEDVYADSLQANGGLREWADVKPRSLSVLPIASACQARCAFCFSHSSVSLDRMQTQLSLARVEEICRRAAAAGATRFVITGGGEPTLLPHAQTIELMRIGAAHFPKTVMITNGHLLGNMPEPERLSILREYRDAGLTVLSVSRHDADRNLDIMGIDTRSERIARSIRDLEGLTLRWVCVLQQGGVADEARLRRYLDWVAETRVTEVCFKELYVSVARESVYALAAYKQLEPRSAGADEPGTAIPRAAGRRADRQVALGRAHLSPPLAGQADKCSGLHGTQRVLGAQPRYLSELELDGRRNLFC